MNPAKAMARILVVDDDPDLLDLISMRLTSAGYAVALAASGVEALAIFRAERPRVVVTDLRMDGMDGHALFERLHAEAPSVPVIILTAHGTIPDAVAATQRGVFSFLTKPFDGRELLARVADAITLSPPIAADRGNAAWRKNIVTTDAVMEELLRSAHRLAEDDQPLLLTGPRGSGKELFARTMHDSSQRARQCFHILRCGTAADSDTEETQFSEALAVGLGGTLFLDDVGQLPPTLQARLLPLVSAAGLFGTRTSAIRVIASTSQSLDPAIRYGRFRADLYYSLKRNTLSLPGLAERHKDIPLLVAHFSAQRQPTETSTASGFSPEALTLLCEAPWPGNVRQLRNIIEQALSLAVVPQVPATLVKRLLHEDNAREMAALDDARKAFEYDYLVQLLKATTGNVAQAARIAQRNRTEFYKLLARHALDPASFKQGRA
ncbi:MAG: response regulator [Gammaproteobacteria bacterium]|nr:response regulator [Rhodocyclaceae bacterium]MBU3910338.1 response regulator [Gammaproteobacteria bacterium]MBU3990268.1 response regulator [Gammaproteobacteria bacterium]MBU4004165.1 response regulator [Gammaproteobacteria bacterium]MBU4020412.1 response regulator [Gammaproteobacteria bacterium]